MTQPSTTPQPALVAVAHGSRAAAAVAAAQDLLDAVRERRPGLDVRCAFLDHGRPRLVDLAPTLPGTAVVVPLLLGAAYHSRVDIPAALAGSEARQTEVLGPDPCLVRALERRLAEAGVAPGDPSTGVVLAAAGSSDPAAVAAVRALADLWRATGWWDVRAAFASAAGPTVEQAVVAVRAAGARRVAVASYLLFPGQFADRIAAAGADVTSHPLTDAPEVAELVLRRYDTAVPV